MTRILLQINSNLYSVPKIIVFKFQKDLSTRTKSHYKKIIVYRQTTATMTDPYNHNFLLQSYKNV